MSLKKAVEKRSRWLARRLEADGHIGPSITARELSDMFLDEACFSYLERFDRRESSVGISPTKYDVVMKKYKKMMEVGFDKIRGWSLGGMDLESAELRKRFSTWREKTCRFINPGDAFKNDHARG